MDNSVAFITVMMLCNSLLSHSKDRRDSRHPKQKLIHTAQSPLSLQMASRCSLPVSYGSGLIPSSFISVEHPRRNRIASHMTSPCSTPQKPPNGLSSSPAMCRSHFPCILPTRIFHAFGYYLVAEAVR